MLYYCPNMISYKGFSTLEILEGASNYNSWIAENFIKKLKSPVIEVGSGTGNISIYFSQQKELFLTDKDPGLITHLKNKFKRKNIKINTLDISKEILRTLQGHFKSAIAINVLEHIKDDGKAFRNLNRLLVQGGRLFILVPAKKFAYTGLDKALGHYRRYEKEELIEKIKSAGFTIEKTYFFNFIGLFSWIVRDKIERGHTLKLYQVALFDKLVPVLKIIEGIIKPPLGVSLIVIARKK